jgi:hypothetical protein
LIRRLRGLLRLSPSDRRLLIRATLLVSAVRIGLWVLPFRFVRALLGRITGARGNGSRHDSAAACQVGWAVETAARCVPAATCLTQALAAQVLLTRHGLPARLHIGVAKDERKRLLAHAWVESQGRVIVGGSGPQRYTSLLVLEGENG